MTLCKPSGGTKCSRSACLLILHQPPRTPGGGLLSTCPCYLTKGPGPSHWTTMPLPHLVFLSKSTEVVTAQIHVSVHHTESPVLLSRAAKSYCLSYLYITDACLLLFLYGAIRSSPSKKTILKLENKRTK